MVIYHGRIPKKGGIFAMENPPFSYNDRQGHDRRQSRGDNKMLPSGKAITSNRLLAVCPDGTNFNGWKWVQLIPFSNMNHI